jgi:GT2 family glycosyltransferase
MAVTPAAAIDVAAARDRGADATVDLTVAIVSFNDRGWLDRCLTTLHEHAGPITVEVIVVDNGDDDAQEVVRPSFPDVTVIRVENRGFGNANNVAFIHGRGRHCLFLNPDTEVLEGTLAELVERIDRSPDIGLVGVRQLTADGSLWPTIRYFPSPLRALGDALSLERLPYRPRWVGERELGHESYEQEFECDWTSGSFMLARREALLSAGVFDERFFLFSEEPDLCLRIKSGGWRVVHMPSLTILHHAGKGGTRPRMSAQEAYTRRQYAKKHFSRARRCAYLSANTLNLLIRAAVAGRRQPVRRHASLLALVTLLGFKGSPFQAAPPTAMPPESGSEASQ